MFQYLHQWFQVSGWDIFSLLSSSSSSSLSLIFCHPWQWQQGTNFMHPKSSEFAITFIDIKDSVLSINASKYCKHQNRIVNGVSYMSLVTCSYNCLTYPLFPLFPFCLLLLLLVCVLFLLFVVVAVLDWYHPKQRRFVHKHTKMVYRFKQEWMKTCSQMGNRQSETMRDHTHTNRVM